MACNCLPPKNVPTFLPIRAPEKTSQTRQSGVAQMENEATMNSLEMDREGHTLQNVWTGLYRTRGPATAVAVFGSASAGWSI